MDTKRWIVRDDRIKSSVCTAINMLDTQDEKYCEVVIRPYKKNRSLAQNNLMWMWLTEISRYLDLEAGISCTPENLKEEFCERYLGYKTVRRSDGGLVERLRGTSKLNTAQFTDFLNRIEAYAASELGLSLPHPEDLYYEAIGK